MKSLGIKNFTDFLIIVATVIVFIYTFSVVGLVIIELILKDFLVVYPKIIFKSNLQFPGLLILCLIVIYVSLFNWIIMGFASIWYKEPKRQVKVSLPLPKVSIIIPAHNEERVINGLLEDLINQSYPDLEIIVIVHNSTDETLKKTIDFAKEKGKDKIRIIKLTTSESGKALALNVGLKKATGTIIAHFDADNRIKDKDYILKAVSYFEDETISAVQTSLGISNGQWNFLIMLHELEYIVFSTMVWKGRKVLNLPAFLAGTGTFIRKCDLLELNGWNNCLVEDFELFTRMSLKNKKIEFANDLIVYDEKPKNWEAVIKQKARWFKGHLQVMVKYFNQVGNLLDYLYRFSPLAVFAWWVSSALFIFYEFTNQISLINVPPLLWLTAGFLLLMFVGIAIFREKKWKAIGLVPLYWLFSFHYVWVGIVGLFVSSWSQTKTQHFGN